MSITVGELFVNLGIKGSEKAVGAITNVKKGLSETASLSLEAKAGIIAAMYALERLFAASGATGTGLTNFNTLLGVSAKTLQQYQFAARQVGVSNQEVEGSFKGLQTTITKTLMGEGAPKGLARVASLTGNLNPQDLLRFQQHPEQLLQRLQEYAKRESNIGLRNETLKSFGLGDSMIAALSRNAFRPESLNRAPTYSDREIGALDKANIAWSNLGQKIEMAVGKFNAKHGVQLVQDISKIVDSVLKLAEAFETLTEKLHLFEVLGKGMEGFANTFKLIGEVVDKIQGKSSKKGDLLFSPPGQEAIPGLKNSPVGKFFQDMFSSKAPTVASQSLSHLPVPALPPTSKTQNVSINQNLNFQHDGKDHRRTSDSVKKAIQDAYRQMSAQGQGT